MCRPFLVLILVCWHGTTRGQQPRLEPFLQTGHTNFNSSMAMSADGKYAVTGSYDGTAILWDTATGKKVQVFHGHDNSVKSVAVSGNGKFVATGSDDDTVALWDLVSGRKVRSFPGHSGYPHTVALTHDGKHLVAGTHASTATLFETATGRKVRVFQADGQQVRSVAVSGDGNHVLTGSLEGKAILWDIDTGKSLHTFPGSSVALSGDGKYAVTAFETEVYLWDRASGKKVKTFQDRTVSEKEARLAGVAVNHDGSHVLAGTVDGRAIVWETADGGRRRDLECKSPDVWCVALSGDGKQAITGSNTNQRTAIVWDARTGKQLHTLERHNGVVSLALSRAGKHLVTGHTDHSASLWGAGIARRLRTFQTPANLSAVAVSSDGKHVVTGSTGDRSPVVWDTTSGKTIATLKGHAGGICCVTLSSDGNLILTGSVNRWDEFAAILWLADGGKIVQTFRGHNDSIRSVALSADETRVVTGSSDGLAALWDVATGKKLQTFSAHAVAVLGVALSEDGKRVATCGYAKTGDTYHCDNTAVVWDAASGKKLQTIQGGAFHYFSAVALTRDGKQLLTAGRNTVLWEADTGKPLRTFEGNGVQLSRDGKQLWTIGLEGAARLWDTATGKERCRLYSFDGGQDWLVVTPEGLFDGSAGAWRFVTYRVPGTLKLVDDDATRRRFHRPGLLAEVWPAK